MRRRIGIVIKNWDDGKIDGYVAETEVELAINDNSGVEVKENIFAKHFIYDTKVGILVPHVFIDWETAKDIAKELIKIGFKNFKMLYNDKLYYFDENNEVQPYYTTKQQQ